MKKHSSGFTLVELLTVMAIIAVLAGLILSTAGFVQKKAANSRAEAEMKAMEAAIGNYKADNGEVPRNTNTDTVDCLSPAYVNPSTYATANLVLYRALSGDTNLDRKVNATDGSRNISGTAVTPAGGIPKIYFEFKPTMLLPNSATAAVTSIVDPFGYSYGYSTAFQLWQEGGAAGAQKGGNPDYDLWSTAGKINATGTSSWIKNW
jgi:prepilin-type N-terminal cleavage/methylation domain-containing protein